MLSDSLDITIVFLGPTLKLDVAKKILPNAIYYPPVKCGDIIKILRLQPKKMVIIDGYFEETAAVWHKEIIYAVEQKVIVIGASSMGALRAAELKPFGMHGVGKVYEWYLNGALDADDEVAVLHGSADQHYRCLTQPMVNIRETLLTAQADGVIDSNEFDRLCCSAKNLFYKKRYFLDIIESGLSLDKHKVFKNWLSNGGYVDVKASDAILALKLSKQLINNDSQPKIGQTAPLAKLISDNNCEPLTISNDFLGIVEQCAKIAVKLPQYHLLSLLAKLLNVSYQLNINSSDNERFANLDLKKNQITSYSDNLKCSIESSFNIDLNNVDLAENEAPFFEGFQIILSPIKSCVFSERILLVICRIWSAIELKLNSIGFEINDQIFAHAVIKFRRQNSLESSESMSKWFNEKNISQEKLVAALKLFAKFDYIVIKHNIDIFERRDNFVTNSLFDALCLTNGINKVVELYNDEQQHAFVD
jgi:hypothetical protein